MNELKERHGFVNACLWLLIIANSGMAIYNVITMFGGYTSSISLGSGLAAILSVVNILGTILLMRWNKCGFYLFMVSALTSAVISITILDAQPYVLVSALFGILIWWGILHIKKNGVTAWQHMKNGWDYKHCRHLYQVFGVILGILIITVIACTSNYNNNQYEKLANDTLNADVISLDTVSASEEDTHETIQWNEFSDENNACTIEAPSDFRKVNLSKDQILGLMCTDYDPAIVIIQESLNSVMSANVTTAKDYANIVVKMNRNAEGITNFKKLSDEPYDDNSHLMIYEASLAEDTYRYNILTTKTESNFYYCQIICLKQYTDKLQPIISHMLSSFKAKK